MKLRNKKTGEIVETDFELSVSLPDDEKLYGNDTYTQIKGYSSIKELSEDWEDYEEPEGWCVTMYGGISKISKNDEVVIPDLEEIGNYFNDKESAYDALEKLKALKRLKDKGFKFDCWTIGWTKGKGLNVTICTNIDGDNIHDDDKEDIRQDLNLLFGE